MRAHRKVVRKNEENEAGFRTVSSRSRTELSAAADDNKTGHRVVYGPGRHAASSSVSRAYAIFHVKTAPGGGMVKS